MPTEPFDTFEARFAEAARKGGHDLVFFSQVFFDSSYRVRDLKAIVDAVPDKKTHDRDRRLSRLHGGADRSFGHRRSRLLSRRRLQIAMAGEGACFLHCPPGYGLRPRDTGWYAGFSALSGGKPDVQYAEDGSRFLGATFDVSALYRFNAVQDWLAREGLNVVAMLTQVRGIERAFLGALAGDALVTREQLMLPDEAQRARFLTFRTDEAEAITEHLAKRNVIVDCRGDRLRFGFAIYHTEDDARAVAAALKRLSAERIRKCRKHRVFGFEDVIDILRGDAFGAAMGAQDRDGIHQAAARHQQRIFAADIAGGRARQHRGRKLRFVTASSVLSGLPSRRTRNTWLALARSRAARRVSSFSAAARAAPAPIGVEARGELGLALQDGAVLQHLQPVGRQRRAGRGDVDNGFGRAGGGRAFGGAGAFDDAVIGNAGTREEGARQRDIFGGDAQAAAMALEEGGADIVEIGHGGDIDPGLRHRHHDIGMAEAQRLQQRDAAVEMRASARGSDPRR